MDKEEKIRKIQGLNDLRLIRYNTGNLFYSILIISMFILTMMMFCFGILFVYLKVYTMTIVFFIFEFLFLFMELYLIGKQEVEENKYLNKYG